MISDKVDDGDEKCDNCDALIQKGNSFLYLRSDLMLECSMCELDDDDEYKILFNPNNG